MIGSAFAGPPCGMAKVYRTCRGGCSTLSGPRVGSDTARSRLQDVDESGALLAVGSPKIVILINRAAAPFATALRMPADRI